MRVQVVFQRGKAFCGGGAESAKAVPGILEAWIADLQAFQVLQAMHAELQAALQQRASPCPFVNSVWLQPPIVKDAPCMALEINRA